MWSWMSCLSPSETSSTKDLSISSRNLLSPSMRITFLKCGSQCCKTAIDSGRHRCHRGAQNLSDLRKRQIHSTESIQLRVPHISEPGGWAGGLRCPRLIYALELLPQLPAQERPMA